MAITKELKEAIEAAKADLRNEFNLFKVNMEDRIDQIELEKQILKDENKDLKIRLSVLEADKANNLAVNKPLFSSFIKSSSQGAPPVLESETRVFHAISSEYKEKAKKEKNIVIFGIKESQQTDKAKIVEEDLKSIESVFDAIGLDKSKISKSFRLRSRDTSKPGALVVELESILYQKHILSISSSLSNIEEYKNKVYINADLTFRERASLKLLLDERKKLNKIEQDSSSPFRFVIRNDMLEKIEIKRR